MRVHLVDGTYELFRQHFGRPEPGAFSATRGVLASLLTLLEQDATHIGVATDHVIESFRNELWAGYKTSAGMPPELLAQFEPLERALVAMGVANWAMVELEADDALAAAAAAADADERVEQVVILTPDKDLAQCVRAQRVVQYDRRQDKWFDAEGVAAKFGVAPESIPDYLALVGDSADGFPGLEGWGAKSAAAVLARYVHLEDIPLSAGKWEVPGLRGAAKLAHTFATQQELAYLFRRIATLEADAPVGVVDDWRWTGPTPEFDAVCAELGDRRLPGLAQRVAEGRRA